MSGMLGGVTMRLRLSTIFGFGFAALATLGVGCSFVLDFPEGVSQASGGGGHGGGADGGGGASTSSTGSACGTPLEPQVLLLEPESTLADQGSYIGALIRRDGQLFLHGSFGGDLVGHTGDFPPNTGLINYVARLDDGAGDMEILGSTSTCLPVCSGTLGALGAVMVDDDVVALGFSPSTSTPDDCTNQQPTELHFDMAGPGSTCGMGNGFLLDPDPDTTTSRIPYVARYYQSAQNPTANLAEAQNGATIDAVATPEEIYVFGLAYGSAWNGTLGNETEFHHYVVRMDADDLTEIATEFIDGFPNAGEFDGGYATVPGGIAIDDEGTIWATGALCADNSNYCIGDRAYFLTRWPQSGAMTPWIEADPVNEDSFGSTIEFANETLVIGGGYTTTLADRTLPPATAGTMDPFVIAVTRQLPAQEVWSWPKATSALDRSRYEAVYDIAVVPDTGCGEGGAVYVAGCVIGPLAADRDCTRAFGDVDKWGFLAKLDLETGEELAVYTLAPDAQEMQLFMPTAIAADTTGLYVAFNLFGSATIPNLGIVQGSAATVESKLIRFSL